MQAPEVTGIEAFGKNIHRIRKAKKLTLEALANMAEIDMSGLDRIERGKSNPKLSTILALAKALEVLPSSLFLIEIAE